jgi:hypothetical protein
MDSSGLPFRVHPVNLLILRLYLNISECPPEVKLYTDKTRCYANLNVKHFTVTNVAVIALFPRFKAVTEVTAMVDRIINSCCEAGKK